MKVEEAIAYIHSIHWRGKKDGLNRIAELLERLGNPQKNLRFIHVAGTNGKGSVCSMLSSILQQAGYKTGLYTSPYIHRFHERIQVDGIPISDEDLCRITAEVREHAESMSELPSEFELICAIAMRYYEESFCDIVVLEVGLGGRLDATNIIPPPLCAVLTAIDYDHTDLLGETLAEIAGEKCGIIKTGSAVVSERQLPEAAAVIERICAERGCILRFASDQICEVGRPDLNGQRFCRSMNGPYKIRLLGQHQLRNAGVVLEAIDVLRAVGQNIPEEAVITGLASACWPARFEVVSKHPTVILDGAHNPHGMRACVSTAKELLEEQGITVLVGLLKDKAYLQMLEILNTIACRFVAVTPDSPRAMPAQELADCLACFEKPVSVIPNPTEAADFARCLAEEKGEVLLCTGSLYLMGPIRENFLNQ